MRLFVVVSLAAVVSAAVLAKTPPKTAAVLITFPLLSDVGSETIKRYGILNLEARGRTAGITYPGTFVLDAKGVAIRRSFEERYDERATVESLLPQAPDRAASSSADKTETSHLTVTTSVSDRLVAPGTRFSLYVDVAPKPRMHVYSPEQKDYISIALTLEPDPAFKPHPAVYPKAEKFFFEPLKETQLVYSKAFRVVQDLTLALTPAFRQRAAAAGGTLTIKGSLRYQACDDQVCYLPKDLPLSWTVGLRALEH
jgi:Thiol:disulfide interchange protein DsbD, N-terminal/AhpC/TSA family